MSSLRGALVVHFAVGIAAMVLLMTSSTLESWEWVFFFLVGVPWLVGLVVLLTRPGPLVAWIFPIVPLLFTVGLWLLASWVNAVSG